MSRNDAWTLYCATCSPARNWTVLSPDESVGVSKADRLASPGASSIDQLMSSCDMKSPPLLTSYSVSPAGTRMQHFPFVVGTSVRSRAFCRSASVCGSSALFSPQPTARTSPTTRHGKSDRSRRAWACMRDIRALRPEFRELCSPGEYNEDRWRQQSKGRPQCLPIALFRIRCEYGGLDATPGDAYCVSASATKPPATAATMPPTRPNVLP